MHIKAPHLPPVHMPASCRYCLILVSHRRITFFKCLDIIQLTLQMHMQNYIGLYIYMSKYIYLDSINVSYRPEIHKQMQVEFFLSQT